MKILQIFGAVVAVHLLAFIFIFASPGCQSSPRNVPTPDATIQPGSGAAPVSFNSGSTVQPVAESAAPADLGTGGAVSYLPPTAPGRAVPTRPGSPNAAAITPAKAAVEDVAPVTTYTVQKGDSLWSIAKKNHLTVSELARTNNLGAGATMQPGKKLIIPGKPGAAKPADLATAPATPAAPAAHSAGAAANHTAAAARPTNGESVKHTVLAGESLGVIARKYQVTVAELAAANNLTSPMIRAGQQLVIPGFKAVGTKGASAKPADPAAAPAATKAPHFELMAPPPGQDLDAGLKDASPEVPTIKVEEPKKDAVTPPKKN